MAKTRSSNKATVSSAALPADSDEETDASGSDALVIDEGDDVEGASQDGGGGGANGVVGNGGGAGASGLKKIVGIRRKPVKKKKKKMPWTVSKKKTQAGKKPHRYRPGTVAIRATAKAADVPDNVRLDPSYRPSMKVVLPAKNIGYTRGSLRTHFNISNTVKVLKSEHKVDEEAKQYAKFMDALSEVMPVSSFTEEKARHVGIFFESDHAVYWPVMIRYSRKAIGDAEVKAALDRKADEDTVDFWHTKNCCPSTAAAVVRILLKECHKPVVVLVGSQQAGAAAHLGHCIAVVVREYPDPNGSLFSFRKAWIKDSLPIEEAQMKNLANDFLFLLQIKKVEMVGELPHEEDVTHTECIREAMKVVGDCLDGEFFYEMERNGKTRMERIRKKK